MALDLEHPQAGPVRQAGIPIKLSDTPGGFRHFAPSLGEHADSVLADAGYTEAEIAAFREAGAV